MSWRARPIPLGFLAFVVAACGSGEPLEPPPGLDPSQEIEMIQVDPDPSDDFFVWETAYEVEGLPKLNVGHVTEEFLESAAREGEDPEDYECVGNSGSNGCAIDEDEPALTGLTFGGADVTAWSWQFVPDGTVAVRFTDQDGQTIWQFPQDRLVVFPDTVPDEPDVDCACRMEAINTDGDVTGWVDIRTSTYTEG